MLTCPKCGQENPEGARFCNACATSLAEARPPGGQERKTVTVVFVDLVGFTAHAEALDPEDVRSVLDPYHERVRAELERYGGTVEKFIGDAVMAVFGAPVAHEDDPERAVRASLAVRDWAAEQPDLQVRVAVNTGEALVTLGARAAEGEAMVAGDVVNTAARMQSGAPVNGVLVGETTYRATRDAIDYREHEPIDAKGKSEPLHVWHAVEPIASRGIDVADTVRTPLVGRERELEVLRSILARVRGERAAQLVTIVGVPGIGKSRLVAELFRILDADPDLIKWRQGRCLPYGDSVTFWALGEIVKAEAGILESDDVDEAIRKLRDAVVHLVPDATEARWLESELRTLVGITGGTVTASTAAWRRFVEAVAEGTPAVFVFEDLHWADDGLLDFLDDLADWLRGVPLLIVATARPELLARRPTWGGGKANATTISLQPLGDDETARLISSLLDRPVQLAETQRALLERAGGNPLFAEQFVRMISERGATSDLPESVQGVIAARLDGLPRQEKELLQEAAVHGKVFWIGAVASALGLDLLAVEDLLRSLERKDFVRRERRSAVAGDMQYAFQHVLVRDVAYGQIPRRRRAEEHIRAAQWIEALGRPDDHAELLAHHYKQALELARATGERVDPAMRTRARDAFAAAGERALALSASAPAAGFFADALELTPTGDPVRPRLLFGRARAVFGLGDPGIPLLVDALDGFRASGDVEGEAQAAALAARYAWFAGDRASCDRYIEIALAAVADRPMSRARAEALSHHAGFLMLDGRYEEALRTCAEALPLAEALGLDSQRARLHIVAGTTRGALGDPGGVEEVAKGLEIARAAPDFDMVVTGYSNLESAFHVYGRLADAKRVWQEMMTHFDRYGFGRRHRSGYSDAAGWAYVEGRWDDALAAADELVGRSEAGDTHFTDASMYSLRGWIRFARGDPQRADSDTRRAVELARASDAQARAAGFAMRAAVSLLRGGRADADNVASELLALGPVLLSALGFPFPTLADAAWVFKDLGREDDFIRAVLDPNPIDSPWIDAAAAIIAGDAVRAADIIDEIGNPPTAAYTRLRSADPGHRARAEEFFRSVGADAFVSDDFAARMSSYG